MWYLMRTLMKLAIRQLTLVLLLVLPFFLLPTLILWLLVSLSAFYSSLTNFLLMFLFAFYSGPTLFIHIFFSTFCSSPVFNLPVSPSVFRFDPAFFYSGPITFQLGLISSFTLSGSFLSISLTFTKQAFLLVVFRKSFVC